MLELLAMFFIGLAWLVPNHYPPWASFYNENCAAAGLLLLVAVTARQWRHVSSPNAAWVVVAVAAIPIVQWAFGLLAFSGDAWISSLYVLGLAAAIATGSAWAGQGGARNAAALLSGATLLASLISCVLALTQGLEVVGPSIYIVDSLPGERPYANLAQPNNLATLIGMGVVGVLLLREQGRLGAWAAAALMIVLLLGAGLTQSRTAMFFGPVIVAGLMMARRRSVQLKTATWSACLATACHWLVTWAWPAIQGALLLQAPPLLNERTPGGGRLEVWPALLDSVSLAPWSGHGWLQVGAAVLAVSDQLSAAGGIWLHGHNLFLELLIWCGYPLGLALIALILYWFVSRARRVATVEAMSGMLVVAVFGVHTMLELPHHYAYFLIPVGLWIGQVEFARGAPGNVAPGWGVAPAAFALVLLSLIWRDYRALEEDFRLVRFENLRIGTPQEGQRSPEAPVMSSLTGFLRFARTTPVAGMSPAELASLEAVARRYPYAPSLARLASAWALNGRLDDARQLFTKIRQIHGDGMYLKLRLDLRERVAEGQAGLSALEQSLPD